MDETAQCKARARKTLRRMTLSPGHARHMLSAWAGGNSFQSTLHGTFSMNSLMKPFFPVSRHSSYRWDTCLFETKGREREKVVHGLGSFSISSTALPHDVASFPWWQCTDGQGGR